MGCVFCAKTQKTCKRSRLLIINQPVRARVIGQWTVDTQNHGMSSLSTWNIKSKTCKYNNTSIIIVLK